MRTNRLTWVLVAAVAAQSLFASSGSIASDQVPHLALFVGTVPVSAAQAACPAIDDVFDEVFSATGKRPSEQSVAWKLLSDRATLRVTLLDVATISGSNGFSRKESGARSGLARDLAAMMPNKQASKRLFLQLNEANLRKRARLGPGSL